MIPAEIDFGMPVVHGHERRHEDRFPADPVGPERRVGKFDELTAGCLVSEQIETKPAGERFDVDFGDRVSNKCADVPAMDKRQVAVIDDVLDAARVVCVPGRTGR